MQRKNPCEENSMRASINRIMLGIMVGCLLMTSVAVAQQEPTLHVSQNVTTAFGMPGQVQDQYVPHQPPTIYTNTNYPVVDPMANAEAAYFQQQANSGEFYPQYYGDQYAYGCQPCTTSMSPRLKCGKWFVTGWLDQGFTYNTDDPNNRMNGPLKYNDRSGEYQFNQLYLSLGRSVATSGCSWDIGGRVDMLYGSDYLWTSAIGLETRTTNNGVPQEDPAALPSRWNNNNGPRVGGASRLGLAMPQVYAEIYVPLGLGLNIKGGHFYSIMGYESVMSPQNFFYSHSYSMMYGQPTTHTGILFSQRLTHRLTGIFGVTRGWDTWEDPNGKLSYLAGIQWNSCDRRTEFSWVGATGNETVSDINNPNGTSRSDAIRYNYSMVLSHQLTPRLKVVAQHDMGYERDAAMERVFGQTGLPTQNYINGHWYSWSAYAFYQLTNKLTLGVRGEWFRDVNSSRIYRRDYFRDDLRGEYIDGQDYSQITIGLNWKPCECLVVRPEARVDWSGVCVVDGAGNTVKGGVFDDFSKKSQTTVALSTYITY